MATKTKTKMRIFVSAHAYFKHIFALPVWGQLLVSTLSSLGKNPSMAYDVMIISQE